MSENTVFELDHFLNNEEKDFLDNCSKKNSLQVLQLKKQFIQESYEKLKFATKHDYKVDSKVEDEQKKEFYISDQIRSLNDSSIVCAARGYTVKCECSSLNQKPIFCGERKLCPLCNKNYSRKIMRKIYRMLTLISNTWWAEVVLTYPKQHFDEELLTKAEIMDLMFKHANAWMKKAYGIKIKKPRYDRKAGVGCVMSCHSNHSKDPLDPSDNFHVHILIPDFVFFPIVEKTMYPYEKTTVDLKKGVVKKIVSSDRTVHGYGSIKKVRFHKSKEKLAADRKAWADIIDYHESDVNVWCEYFNCKKKLMHKITYIVRGAIKDYNDYFLKKGNQNRLMTLEEIKKFYYHVEFPRGFKRVRWYGFLSNSQRSKFLKTITNLELKDIIDPIYLKTFDVCSRCFRRFISIGSEEMDFDGETMKRTLRMDLITYENYHKCKMKKE